MSAYRLTRWDRRTYWVGGGVRVVRDEPLVMMEGPLDAVLDAAVEEIVDVAEWYADRGDIPPEDVPTPADLKAERDDLRKMAEGRKGCPEDVALDPEGVWCLTVEAVK